MNKNILIINSYKNAPLFFEALKGLENKNFYFAIHSTEDDILISAQKLNWATKKNLSFLKITNNKSLLFTLLYPLFWLYSFVYVLSIKYKYQADAIICCGMFEKIFYTRLAKLFAIKVFWFEFPETKYKKLLTKAARFATIIAPMEYIRKKLLNCGFNENDIKLIKLGANLNAYRHQENIFSKIAATENKWPQRKFFTVGTIVNLSSKKYVETLFNAAKKFTDVIRFPQIIIIGEGEERKNLTWTAKKMQIDNFIWFVGEQHHFKKWLDTFDVFVVTTDVLELNDLNVITRALADGLPVIGNVNIGLEELVKNGDNGYLIDMANSEELAQAIMRLQQNKNLRLLFGERSKKMIDQNYSVEQTIDSLFKLLNEINA